MNRPAVAIAVVQGALLAGLTLGVAGHWFPLGVPGEWEWLRLPASIAVNFLNLAVGGAAVVGYSLFAAWGVRALGRADSRGREAVWVVALALLAVVAQAVVQEGAPEGYGLAKWILALREPGSSGYHTVARDAMPDGLGPFLADYPGWISEQDSLHIGTHPPGLFVLARAALDLTRTHPGLARWVVNHAPGSVAPMIRLAGSMKPIAREDAAALVLTGALTLLGSALTVIPLYLLVRATQPAPTAWAAATLWPMMPAALLFQPTADTAFPLLAMAALALATWGVRVGRGPLGIALAIGSGLVLAIGIELTLAYLAVGLVVALLLIGTPGSGGLATRGLLVGATGLGFVGGTLIWWGLTRANPVAIWWINQRHHARFYLEYPRNRGLWSLVNLGESAVAIGLASTVLAVWGALRPRANPTVAWATLASLVLLTISGRSLSEVARIWLPLFPALLAFAAVGWHRLGSGPASLSWSIGCLGAQTLALENLVQVVYPT